MGLRTTHLIGLIAGAMVMWDQSLLVEMASDREDTKASGVLPSRLPPDIVIPLPYVYPEYVDPREQTTAAPSSTEDNRAEQTTSVSDIILENVRQTMLVSTPMREFVPTVHENNAVKNRVQGKNRHVTSTMRTVTSNDNNDDQIVKEVVNGEPTDETQRPFGKRPRFGTRIRTSTTHFMKQNSIKATTAATPIAKCINDANDTESTSLNYNLPRCRQQLPTKHVSANAPINGTDNSDNVTLRRRPASRTRQVVVRRRRPNPENARTPHRSVRKLRVKNAQSDLGVRGEKPENKAETETLSNEE